MHLPEFDRIEDTTTSYSSVCNASQYARLPTSRLASWLLLLPMLLVLQSPQLHAAGWVCYAEKTHGSYILPYISSTRSPQGIMGALVKQQLGKLKGWDPAQIYHVTVMPCYDKKLEASRDDFLVPGESQI